MLPIDKLEQLVAPLRRARRAPLPAGVLVRPEQARRSSTRSAAISSPSSRRSRATATSRRSIHDDEEALADPELRELAHGRAAGAAGGARGARGLASSSCSCRPIRTTRRTPSSRSAAARAAKRRRSSRPISSACTRATPRRKGWKIEVLTLSESADRRHQGVHRARHRQGRLLAAALRGRRAPRAARAGDRDAGAHPHLDGDGGGAARGRRRRRADRREGPRDQHRRERRARRAGRQHDQQRRADPAQADAASSSSARTSARSSRTRPRRSRSCGAACSSSSARSRTTPRRPSAAAWSATGERSQKIRTYNYPAEPRHRSPHPASRSTSSIASSRAISTSSSPRCAPSYQAERLQAGRRRDGGAGARARGREPRTRSPEIARRRRARRAGRRDDAGAGPACRATASFALFENPEVRRARARSAVLRGHRAAARRGAGQVEGLAVAAVGDAFELRYRVPGLRIARRASLSEVELACVRLPGGARGRARAPRRASRTASRIDAALRAPRRGPPARRDRGSRPGVSVGRSEERPCAGCSRLDARAASSWRGSLTCGETRRAPRASGGAAGAGRPRRARPDRASAIPLLGGVEHQRHAVVDGVDGRQRGLRDDGARLDAPRPRATPTDPRRPRERRGRGRAGAGRTAGWRLLAGRRFPLVERRRRPPGTAACGPRRGRRAWSRRSRRARAPACAPIFASSAQYGTRPQRSVSILRRPAAPRRTRTTATGCDGGTL